MNANKNFKIRKKFGSFIVETKSTSTVRVGPACKFGVGNYPFWGNLQLSVGRLPMLFKPKMPLVFSLGVIRCEIFVRLS